MFLHIAELPQQHAAGHTGVQAFHLVCHRDTHSQVTGGHGGIRQALALAANDYAESLRELLPGFTQRAGVVQSGGPKWQSA